MQYDSTEETNNHILLVRAHLYIVQGKLEERGFAHDQSKLQSPEKEGFDEVTGVLKGLTYGSEEYKAQLVKLKPILDHHYAKNSHHPEHYPNGIDGMSLLDVIEMFCDWKAATQRHADGNLKKSIEINKSRFKMTEQMAQVFENTRIELNW